MGIDDGIDALLDQLDDAASFAEPTDGSPLGQLLHAWGKEITDKLKKSADKHRATANLEQSIKYTAEAKGTKFVFTLIMADYYEALDKGRKAGKMPPVEPIREWVAAKASFSNAFSDVKNINDFRVQKGLAYVIARKIGKKGTEPTNWYSSVVNDAALNDLKQRIEDLWQ